MELPSGQATATRLLLLHETGSFVVFLCNKNNGTSTYFCNYQMELPSGKTTATQLLLLQETFFFVGYFIYDQRQRRSTCLAAGA